VAASSIASVVAADIFTWLFCGFDSSSIISPQAPMCKTIISTSLKKSGAFIATPMTKLQQEGKQGKQLAHHTKSP